MTKIEDNGSPKAPQKRAKNVKKEVLLTPSLSYGVPWAPRGSQEPLFDGFWLHFWVILCGFWMAFGWYFHDFPTLQGSHFSLELLKSGNKTLYPDTDCPHVLTLGCIWGRLLHLRHHSLRRFPVPLVSTGIYIYIYIYIQSSLEEGPPIWRNR